MKTNTLPVFHFEGEVVVEDEREFTNGYLSFPFVVPEGVSALRLHLDYHPLKVGFIGNLITLGVFAPAGFRGNAHRQKPDQEVILSTAHATPGFIPGPIQAGDWLAQLAIQSVVKDSRPCRYTLDIELLDGDNGGAPAQPFRLPARKAAGQQPGWFRGELHSHTLHSDGELTLNGLLARARERALDFIALTDHNTISALGGAADTDLDGLLLIPGMEFTTFRGHALALGIDHFIDWRTGYNGWTMEDAARETRANGGVFIVAHPSAIGSPLCTGCRWEYDNFDMGLADAVEIWNGSWSSGDNFNPDNLALWHALLAEGRRIPATCGADFHSPSDWQPGFPWINVYAKSLSVPDILDGIRQGRMIISGGPLVNLRAGAEDTGAQGGIGDTLSTGDPRILLEAAWKDAPDRARLVIRSRQAEAASETVNGQGTAQHWVEIQPEDDIWAEMFAENGDLLAVTNPVHVRPRNS